MVRGNGRGFSPVALRQQLKRAGYSAEEVADQVGVSRQAVSAWLTGRRAPSPGSLARLAELLHVTTADLTPGVPDSAVSIQDVRVRAGMSQIAAASALRVGQSSLSDIERGRKPLDADLASRMADLYKTAEAEVVDAWEIAVSQRREYLAARRRAN